jgi:predicted transcriptional regulator of viral defense system
VYISSSKRFRNFEYNSIRYKYVSSKLEKGIIKPKNTENIRVTNIERTLIDSIKDYKKIGGFEELINCIKNIYYLDEIKLKDYLDEYNIQALYQKTGFILKEFMDDLYISDEFIEYCKSKIGESTRYLIDKKEENYYDEDWKLVIPKDLFNKIDQGGGELV